LNYHELNFSEVLDSFVAKYDRMHRDPGPAWTRAE
jgi:hypothetical protein